MGIRGLYSYIIKNSEGSFEPFTLKNTKIIIDGRSLSYHLFDLSQRIGKSKYIIGSDYEEFSRFLTDFFKKLISHHVNFLVVLNGCFRPGNRRNIEKKYTKCISSNFDLFVYRKEGIHHTAFRDDILLSVMKKLKIKFVKCTFDSDEIISVTSKTLGYPILTGNSDYFLYGNDCILFDTIELDKKTLKLTDSMACKIFRSDKFVKSFPGLSILCMPLLSILMDQDDFNDELLKKILTFELSTNKMVECHNKITAILNWLSNHTLESASEKMYSLLTPVGKSSKPLKKFIEAHVNRYTTLSFLTLKFLVNEPLLQITEEAISSVKNKFFKFMIDKKKRIQSDKLYDKLVKRDDDNIKERVYNITPQWLINFYLKGHFHSFIISMIGLKIFIPWYHLEDLDYPSAFIMSIPLIELIYRLLSSCTNVHSIQPLRLMVRIKSNAYYLEIKVDKYPKSLGAIRTLNVTKRLEIINNVLRVADSENFKDLPENWRLYVATAIFWFKQDVEPKKNKNHLKALLLAMFFGKIEKVIGYGKNYNIFYNRHKTTMENITSKDISLNNEDDEITTIQAIEKICQNDAVMTANYLIPLVNNRTKRVHNDVHPNLSTVTIHIYSQFEICLHFSKNLNALLNLPYHQIIIEQIFMRPLIYNLYLDISQHPNVDEYIANTLKYAPTVLRCFKLLSKKVNSLLNE